MESIKITNQYAGERIDKICFKVLKNAKKSFVFKMFRKKNIVLNGKKIKGDERCALNDEIQFYFSKETFQKFSAGDTFESEAIKNQLPLLQENIIYEDEHILVYNKPKAILSQPNGKDDNIVEQYSAYAKKNNIVYQDVLDRYGVCNRLDRNTTGLILIGKNALALRNINQSIKSHQVDKRYRAIVLGQLDATIELKGYQKKGRDNQVHMVSNASGDYIHTIIHPMAYDSDEDWTLVEVELMTGKTHQIRHHLSSIHHPIIGDLKYGVEDKNTYFYKKYGVQNQLLHSYSYTFLHIEEPLAYLNKQQFIAPYPKIFKAFLGKGEAL